MDDPGWQVPGHDLLELLGYGGSGELWRARRRPGGELVAVRRLVDPEPAVLAVLRQEATVVRSLASRHVVRVRRVLSDALVLDHADGGSLAALLAVRGRLAPGEVVTAVAPVAQVLAEAHAAGLVHGHISPAAVLLTGQGMPLLDDLGRSALRPPAPGGPADDVRALGALCRELLTGSAASAGEPLSVRVPDAPAPLLAAVELARRGELGADALAAALLASCPPVPLHRPPPVAGRPAVAGPAATPARRHRPPPRLLRAAAAAAALLLVVLTGWVWGRSGEAGAAHGVPPAWSAVLEALDGQRAAAFARADPPGLAEVYVPGSAALQEDSAALAALAAADRTARGVQHRVTTVEVAAAKDTTVRLRVVEQLGSYDVLDRYGAVVEHRPPGALQSHAIVLRRTPAGWRVASVAPEPVSPASPRAPPPGPGG